MSHATRVGSVLHLIQHAELQLGIDVTEKDVPRLPKLLGNLGLEIGKHAEPRFERVPFLEVEGVLPLPPEALAGGARHTVQVDAPLGEAGQIVERIVLADHAHHLDRVQVARGGAEEHRRAAERILGLAERCLDGIERDAADNEQGQGYIRSGAETPKRFSPFASTIWTARASTSRARSTGSGAPRTRCR